MGENAVKIAMSRNGTRVTVGVKVYNIPYILPVSNTPSTRKKIEKNVLPNQLFIRNESEYVQVNAK